MKILLPIKPEFATKIFNGSKKYELRRKIFHSEVNNVVVYATSPIQKVIGEFEIDQIIKANPNELWQITNGYSGISKNTFDAYFQGKQFGYAIKIKSYKKYNRPLSLKRDFKIHFPPQSFQYLNKFQN